MFYFVISNGTFLSKKLGQNYVNITKSLEEKLQALNIQGNIEPILQMDLLIRMLNFQPELRPSAQKVLHHPLFWADKRCFKFILEICKKIDVLDPKLAREIKNGMEHEKVLDEKPILKQLKVALDLDKSVVYDDWISKLDPMLAEEFKSGYDKESVSDLLKAIRNKVLIPLNSLNLFINLIFYSYFSGFTKRSLRIQ